MHRVETNVRTLVERLTAMQYVFAPRESTSGALPLLSGLVGALLKAHATMFGRGTTPKPRAGEPQVRAHVPPGRDAQRDVANFEKEFGALPLSLRAFYEVVGEVNLIGYHPTLDPLDNPLPPTRSWFTASTRVRSSTMKRTRTGAPPAAITIAPDDLHKANVSGGEPYTMAVPDRERMES